MEKIIRTGIVVVSPQNNPAIMTPKFLMEYEISPKNWEVLSIVESSLLAQIVFKNGYSILSESGKVVFQFDLKADEEQLSIQDCKIEEIAINYLNQISKVKYNNVGINYVLITDECKDAFSKLFSPKIEELSNISPLQVKFQETYSDIADQNLVIVPGKYQPGEDMRPCLEFRGNLHFNINEPSIEKSWEKTKEIIASWTSYVEPFSTMVNKFKDVLND